MVMGLCCLTLVFGMMACGKTENGSETGKQEPEVTATALPEATPTPEPTATPEPTVTPKPTATPEPTHAPAKNESVKIPKEYTKLNVGFAGKVEYIEYATKDYFGDGADITKHAYVYLPPQYDETKQYNVLYLMHGIGGDEKEWGIHNAFSEVKLSMDNMIYYGDIEPFIIVVPNGRSSAAHANTSSDSNAFYKFGEELRNDLIPYIDANYATYAEYSEEGYDLTATRDHRAMAGLSMGAMQTINIGLCECLDIMSWFGVFSAGFTSYEAPVIAEKLQAFAPYDIHYIYNICGSGDGGSMGVGNASFNGLADLTDKVVDGENLVRQTVGGGHEMKVWTLGFYNFAQIVFR